MKTAFRNLVLLWVLALCALPASAEHDVFGLGTGRDGVLDLSGARVINAYAQVTADVAAGAMVVPVASATGFGPGDLVMVLRTTGMDPAPAPGGDDDTFFDLRSSPVGQWELARLESVTSAALRLTQPLIRAYTGGVTQVIRVPEFSSVNINSTGSLQARAWDGATGGVVAFLATGAVTNNGVITASGAGFQGGTAVADSSGQTGCADVTQASPQGQERGEGLASTEYGTTGRGSMVHGGGGGVCRSSGGGGGGHSGNGGMGGRSWFSEPDGGARVAGGHGGGRLDYSLLDRMTFGGGGGAGHCSTASAPASSGGAGGGALFIRAFRLTGSGQLLANGASPAGVSGCGAGGGGAGGSILLRLMDVAQCNVLQAHGGEGGNVAVPREDITLYRGPGGGGGGGQVHIQAATAGCPASTHAGHGGAIIQSDRRLTEYGAQSGHERGPVYRIPGLRIPEQPVLTEPASGSALNNPRPRLAGTASAGSQVLLFLDGASLGSVLADASGRFSFTPSADLPDGPHRVTAVAELDALRSLSSPALPFTVDTVPPTLLVDTPAEDSVVATRLPVISGRSEAGSTVTVSVDGQRQGNTVVSAGGTWSFTVGTQLADGPHTVVAQAVDAAGNSSPASAERRFSVDSVPPGAPVLVEPVHRALISNARPAMSGTAEPGSTVTVLIDGGVAGTVTANGQGEWSFLPTQALGDGVHRVSARAMDAANNTGPVSSAHEFTVDATPPLAPVVATPAEGAVVGTSFSVLTGTAEPGTTVSAVLDGLQAGSARVDAAGRWSLTLQLALLPGPHSVGVSATDAAGNAGPEAPARGFTVDATPPAAPRLTAPATGAVLAMNRPAISGTAEPGSTVTVLLDGEALGTAAVDGTGAWSFLPPVRLADGAYLAQARALDGVGLSSPLSAALSFTVDTTAPDTLLSGGPEGATQAREATFELAASEPGATFECRVDAGAWAPCASPLRLEALAEGAHSVEVRAQDTAGNVDATAARHGWTVTTPKEVGGGGCAAGGGGALAPLGWLAWAAWLMARGRRG